MTEQRTAIVTGAGTGIGKSVAMALLEAGWNTVFCGRRKSVLDAAIGSLETTLGTKFNAATTTQL